MIILNINGKLVKRKNDTGAEVDVMPKRVFDQLSVGENLKSTSMKLRSYGGNDIPVLGTVDMLCDYKQERKYTKYYVVETTGRTVLSLKTCKHLKTIQLLDEIKKTESNEAEKSIKEQKRLAEEKGIMEKVKELKGNTEKSSRKRY